MFWFSQNSFEGLSRPSEKWNVKSETRPVGGGAMKDHGGKKWNGDPM